MKFFGVAIILSVVLFSCKSVSSSRNNDSVMRDSVFAAIAAAGDSAIIKTKAILDAVSKGTDTAPSPIPPSFKLALQIDSAEAMVLEKKFRKQVDEFENKIWYTPTAAPQDVNNNSVFCYFSVKDGVAENLRFKLHYLDTSWLQINHISFLINGTFYQYFPNKVNKDNGSKEFWEWIDTNVSSALMPAILALANAKVAYLKLSGETENSVNWTFTQDQLTAIRETIQLYIFMGGGV